MHPLECQDVSAAYGRHRALEGVSFGLEAGRVLGVLGPNGSGKTTLFKVLLGLKRPEGGTVRILGGRPGEAAVLRRLGATLEGPSCYPHLTGLENLQATAHLKGLRHWDFAATLADVGLSEAASTACSAYSMGMLQRLALAQAILGDPELLILDEPTNGLDPEGVRWIREWIRRRAVSGRTVVLASHLLAEVAQVADEILVLREGRPRFHGRLEDLGGPEVPAVRIRLGAPEPGAEVLRRRGFAVRLAPDGALEVEAPPSAGPELARAVLEAGLDLFELRPARSDLEARYLHLMEAP